MESITKSYDVLFKRTCCSKKKEKRCKDVKSLMALSLANTHDILSQLAHVTQKKDVSSLMGSSTTMAVSVAVTTSCSTYTSPISAFCSSTNTIGAM